MNERGNPRDGQKDKEIASSVQRFTSKIKRLTIYGGKKEEED